jgi:hypothetical protein
MAPPRSSTRKGCPPEEGTLDLDEQQEISETEPLPPYKKDDSV